jgi:hypothetical protein
MIAECLKSLKEHIYASKYEHFEPFPHFIYYINQTTCEPTLNQIVQTATTSNTFYIFILGTGSVNIYKKENKLALIQIKILLPHNSSMVLIFQMCHLLRQYQLTFKLIQNLFGITLNHDKKIYIWGKITELSTFII